MRCESQKKSERTKNPVWKRNRRKDQEKIGMKIKTYVREHKILLLILCIAAAARLISLGRHPAGVLPDEAYGAYNAWALMTEGIDSRGYGFPVYFVAWGSGMNVLYSYLAIPFFWLFGATTTVYRIPQALFGILGVYAAYVLGRELLNEKFGLFFSFAMAINPWSIMNNRFALESNLAPSLFIIAVTLLVLGVKKKAGYLPFAALVFGATLYSYAQSWIVIPIFLILFLLVYRKSIPFGKHLWISVGILLLLAWPLVYFVGVNLGILPEIKTAFFSIPRLPGFRGEELSAGNIFRSVKDLCRLVLTQYDGIDHTSCGQTGSYYYFTTPFLILGILLQLTEIFRHGKKEKQPLEYVMLLWLVSAGIMSVLNSAVTVIHVNLIHIPIIFYGVYGMWKLADKLKCAGVVKACLTFFLFSLGVFCYYYATNESNRFWGEEGRQALQAAKERDNIVTVVVPATLSYGNVLWEDKIPVREFIDTVVYSGNPAWAATDTFANYRYIQTMEEVTEDGVYLTLAGYGEELEAKGYEIIAINKQYSLAVRGTAQ